MEELWELAQTGGQTEIRKLAQEVYDAFGQAVDPRLWEVFRSGVVEDSWFLRVDRLERTYGHRVWNAFLRGDGDELSNIRDRVLDALYGDWRASRRLDIGSDLA